MDIDPVLVEKAAKAIYELCAGALLRPWEKVLPHSRKPFMADAEAVIRVVFDELGLEDLYDALRLLAAAYHDEALISDTLEVEYDDLFDRKLLAQSRDIVDEYTTYLTREGYELVVAQLKRHWRLVEQGDTDGD